MNTKTQATLLLLLLFVLGLTGGFFLGRHLGPPPPPPPPDAWAGQMLQRSFGRMLRLDSAQRKAINPILRSYAQRVGQLMHQHRKDILALQEDLARELKPHLNDPQIRRLQRHLERVRKHARPPRHERFTPRRRDQRPWEPTERSRPPSDHQHP